MTNRKTFWVLFRTHRRLIIPDFSGFLHFLISGEVLCWVALVGNRKPAKRVVTLGIFGKA